MKSLFFILLFVAAVLTTRAQQRDNDNSLKGISFKERIVTGGGLGFNFTSSQDFISLSPMIGYRITEKLVAGANITYRYTKYKFYSPAIKLTDYGVGPFLRYTIFQNVFVQAEYEYLNYEFPTTVEDTERKVFSSFLAGGGYFQPVGDKAAFYITALYNFSYRQPKSGEYSPYYTPIILRAGITLGF